VIKDLLDVLPLCADCKLNLVNHVLSTIDAHMEQLERLLPMG